jgi:hypothetical protein
MPNQTQNAALLEALKEIDHISQAFHEGGYGKEGDRKAMRRITELAQTWLKFTSPAQSEESEPPLDADDGAAHMYPWDLERFKSGEHVGEAFSIPVGCPQGKSVPLYTIEQVRAAIAADRKREGEVDNPNTVLSLEAAQGTGDDLQDAAELIAEVIKAETNGAALGAILSYRQKVRHALLVHQTSAAPVSAGLSEQEIKDIAADAGLPVGAAWAYHTNIIAFARALSSRLLPPDWVAVKDRLLIDVCYIEGDDPFICGVYGKAPLNTLADIEAQLCQSIEEEDGLLTEEGEYRFTARYEPAQRGDYGRIEFEAYWDLTQVSFTPLDEAIEGNSQQAKSMPNQQEE